LRPAQVLDERAASIGFAFVTTMRQPHYALEFAAVTVSTEETAKARVRVRHTRAEETVEKESSGDGPIDALYQAIDLAVDEHHEVVNYTIRSVTEGADAQGEVRVLIDMGGPLFAGRATGTDVVLASAEAYVNALNGLAAFRAEEESVAFVGAGIMRAFDETEE
jgi:2-isopropylmalate synthase